ncbi:hypothetical protein DIPPA_24299 [Diplonema papillatum]|nr:hypothetical protein DIPPA_24299 [Diplonema papillatum]
MDALECCSAARDLLDWRGNQAFIARIYENGDDTLHFSSEVHYMTDPFDAMSTGCCVLTDQCLYFTDDAANIIHTVECTCILEVVKYADTGYVVLETDSDDFVFSTVDPEHVDVFLEAFTDEVLPLEVREEESMVAYAAEKGVKNDVCAFLGLVFEEVEEQVTEDEVLLLSKKRDERLAEQTRSIEEDNAKLAAARNQLVERLQADRRATDEAQFSGMRRLSIKRRTAERVAISMKRILAAGGGRPGWWEGAWSEDADPYTMDEIRIETMIERLDAEEQRLYEERLQKMYVVLGQCSIQEMELDITSLIIVFVRFEIVFVRFEIVFVRFEIVFVRFEIVFVRFEIVFVRFEIVFVRFEIVFVRFEIVFVRFEIVFVRFEIVFVRFEIVFVRFEIVFVRFEILERKELSIRQVIEGEWRLTYQDVRESHDKAKADLRKLQREWEKQVEKLITALEKEETTVRLHQEADEAQQRQHHYRRRVAGQSRLEGVVKLLKHTQSDERRLRDEILKMEARGWDELRQQCSKVVQQLRRKRRPRTSVVSTASKASLSAAPALLYSKQPGEATVTSPHAMVTAPMDFDASSSEEDFNQTLRARTKSLQRRHIQAAHISTGLPVRVLTSFDTISLGYASPKSPHSPISFSEHPDFDSSNASHSERSASSGQHSPLSCGSRHPTFPSPTPSACKPLRTKPAACFATSHLTNFETWQNDLRRNLGLTPQRDGPCKRAAVAACLVVLASVGDGQSISQGVLQDGLIRRATTQDLLYTVRPTWTQSVVYTYKPVGSHR